MVKIWNNYIKEMKIASSGFYFYIEFVMAIIIVLALFFLVPTESKNHSEEIVFFNMSQDLIQEELDEKISNGDIIQIEDTRFKLKPIDIEYTSEDGSTTTKNYDDKKEIYVTTYEVIDQKTGKVENIQYIVNSFEDLIRLSFQKKLYGTEIYLEEDDTNINNAKLNVFFIGHESDKFINLIKASYGTLNSKLDLLNEIEDFETITLEEEQKLNNRVNLLPMLVVYVCGLMGLFVSVSYITVDKSENVLKAMLVTPFKISSYLLSKVMVSTTTALISALIIVFPIMLFKINYLLFILTVVNIAVLFNVVGLIIGAFHDDIKSSFGTLFIVMIPTMLPILTYILPSFNPSWISLIPTHYMIKALKELMFTNYDALYILTVNGFMIVLSFVLFVICNNLYKVRLKM